MTDAMTPVKVGVIGIGNMGWHHARVLSLLRDAELVAVADPDAERGQLAVDQFECRWVADYQELLGQVEAVCIAVPTLLHHGVGMACLKAGVHVLIEKPIAASQEEAAELIQAAEASGRLLQVGHIERFNPAFRELLKVVANEDVVVLEARRHSPNPDRANDVSVVLDLMIHDIDLVLELAGAPVVRLAAAGGCSAEGPIDYVNATLGLPTGWWRASRPARWPTAKSAASAPTAGKAWWKRISSTAACASTGRPASRFPPTTANSSTATMASSKR